MNIGSTRRGRRARWNRAGLCVLALGCLCAFPPQAIAQISYPHATWQVKITSPIAGAVLSGTVLVRANAKAKDIAVLGTYFLLDGAALGAELPPAPSYALSWDTRTAPDGLHVLTAIMRLADGSSHASVPVPVTVSNTAPATQRSEENAAALAPAGAWAPIDSAAAGVTLSGGQAIYSATAGATATLTFTGTGVAWLGFPCEICGTARVHLDGSSIATVDTYAAARPAASTVLYTMTGLPSGSHTLVIEVTGTADPASAGANVDVDAFDVEGVSSSSGGSGGGTGGGGSVASRIEETAPSVAYTGTWIPQSRSDLSGGSVVESNDPSGSATLTFNGTGVSWIGFKGPWAGIAQVSLDGGAMTTVDTYAPAEQAQAVMYTAAGLPPGSHTLTIQVTGTWSASSVSAWIVVDAFDVTSGN